MDSSLSRQIEADCYPFGWPDFIVCNPALLNEELSMGGVYHEVAVTNDDQGLAIAKVWCMEGGYPKASITFVRREDNDRIYSIRDPDLEKVMEIKVDIFGNVHPQKN